MEIMIKQLAPEDIANFKAMLLLFEEVFEMNDFSMPPDAHLANLLSYPHFLAFAAIHRGQMIGGITAHIFPSYYQQSAQVYIYDLAVKAAHRRKGFGKMLLDAVRSYAVTKGYTEVFVQAEDADQHALDFYRAAGGWAEKVTHFTYTLTS